jgi:hypothetical protein
MPAQDVDDAILLKGIEAESFGFFIATLPTRSPSPLAFGRVASLTGFIGPRRNVCSING